MSWLSITVLDDLRFEVMDLPVIETPVFPRWVWMEEITYSHIPIATLVTAAVLWTTLFLREDLSESLQRGCNAAA